MKLSTSHHFTTSGRRGLQKFGRVLLNELQSKYGVKIVSEYEKSDIHLNVINGELKKKSKNILRIDGVYYDIKRRGMNSPIKQSIINSDGVIFQSRWCKKFVTKMLQTQPKKHTVVYNGVRQSEFQKTSPLKREFEQSFVCCAHWRINKRLKNIVYSVLETGKRTGMNLGLYVIGKPDYEYKSKNIIYPGNVKKVLPYYTMADYMCHICHIDACPNAVIEGLSAGLPVVCNNIGGTPEIVKDCGVAVELDRPFNFKYIAHMSDVGPDFVDNEKLIKGMTKVLSRNWDVNRPDLDISISAKGYYDFFLSVLG